MILAGQRSMNTSRTSSLQTLMTRSGRTVRREKTRKTNKERRCRFHPADRKKSAFSSSTAFSSRSGPSFSESGQPNRRVYSSSQHLGPCFKISSFLYFTRYTYFVFTLGFMALLQGHIQYYPVFVGYFRFLFFYLLLVSAELRYLLGANCLQLQNLQHAIQRHPGKV